MECNAPKSDTNAATYDTYAASYDRNAASYDTNGASQITNVTPHLTNVTPVDPNVASRRELRSPATRIRRFVRQALPPAQHDLVDQPTVALHFGFRLLDGASKRGILLCR
jgi:hypothetical protein